MRLIGSVLIVSFLFLGCQEGSNHHASLLGDQKKNDTKNVLRYKNEQRAKELQNKLEISKIEAQTKIEVAKVQSQNQLKIAQVKAVTDKDIAKYDYEAKVKTSEIDARTTKETMRYMVYIAGGFFIVFLIWLFFHYLSTKRKRELERQMHEQRLRHEQFLKERELEEQRVHKLLDLLGDGKIPENMQKEVIQKIAPSNKRKLIGN
jgi:ABC-type multidrug transport system fused ATPase/permease subunit